MPHLSRRAFLRRSALAAAGTALAACGDEDLLAPAGTPGRLPGEKPPLRIVVVGAGMAGLVAAWELARAGHDVTVLEARNRVGGRVLTLRDPFAEGHSAEAGAARVPPEHDLTLAYADHFGLVMDRFYPPDGTYLSVEGDARIPLSPEVFLGARPDYLKVRGGTDRLPRAFAADLGARVRLGVPAGSVQQTGGGVRVRGPGVDVTADRVLCAVPVTVLDRIAFDPPLSGEKREAAAGGFDYRASTRVFVRFGERFWREEGYNGWAVTDWPEELWHPTWDRPGPGGVLLSYVRGERAESLDALPEAGRVARVLEHWEEVFPGAGDHAVGGTTHSWALDPWSRGAWAAPTPAQDAELGPHLDAPEGRVHFAGEHASRWRGWMQGALASGIRAAQSIHSAA